MQTFHYKPKNDKVCIESHLPPTWRHGSLVRAPPSLPAYASFPTFSDHSFPLQLGHPTWCNRRPHCNVWNKLTHPQSRENRRRTFQSSFEKFKTGKNVQPFPTRAILNLNHHSRSLHLPTLSTHLFKTILKVVNSSFNYMLPTWAHSFCEDTEIFTVFWSPPSPVTGLGN